MRPKKDSPGWKSWSRRGFLRRGSLGGLAWAAGAPAQHTQAQPALIKLDTDRVRGRVNRLIYGNFIEHLGRCIYGGVYEEGSPLSDQDSFRTDVLEAARGMGVSILRWPGGNFVSDYDWRDGVGPKDERPRRFDTAWFAEESNRFGTDEFVAYCRKLGAEPYIAINMGTGTLEQATGWVEYCNATTNTHYANLRRRHGHPEPHAVKYWSLGNEVYGPWQAGHKSAEEYATQALEFAKMMKWVDPSISLVAVGAGDADWNRIVLEKLGRVVDYIAIHAYVGSDDYYELLGSINHVEQRLEMVSGVIDAVYADLPLAPRSLGFPTREKPAEIAFDEWNVWYRARDGREREVKNKLEEHYDLRDALWVASVLNTFQRWCQKVTIANMAQMVNVIAPIFTNPQGLFLQTIYFPLALYASHCGEIALDAWVRSDSFSTTRYGETPYLDVSATLSDDRRTLSLAVVNRHERQPLAARLVVTGAQVQPHAKVFEISGPGPRVKNSFTNPEQVKTTSRDWLEAGNEAVYEFPAHAVSLLKLQLS